MTRIDECRLCGAPLCDVVVDLGMSPLSNDLIDPARAGEHEALYPLRVFACDRCRLVQLPAVESPQRIFGDYAYFSSYSTTWIEHARAYARDIAARLALGAHSLAVELASNDGYLLRELQGLSIPVLGIEPAQNVARVAQSAGIPTIAEFFGANLARRLVAQGRGADLVVANNVLAHVPDLNDFVAGIAVLLKSGGTATIEFPHLLRTVERGEFDTIYHEHFSYFSLHTAERALARHDLRVVDAEELPTHGGSLRLYVKHQAAADGASAAVVRLKAEETKAGLEQAGACTRLQEAARRVRAALPAFLREAARRGKRVAGYGAPAKATTLLNYCEVRTDVLAYTVDRNPHKQGRLIPGVRVPIERPERIFETRPDYVLVLPWNLKDEIVGQMAGIRAWGGKFVVPIPAHEVID